MFEEAFVVRNKCQERIEGVGREIESSSNVFDTVFSGVFRLPRKQAHPRITRRVTLHPKETNLGGGDCGVDGREGGGGRAAGEEGEHGGGRGNGGGWVRR